MSDQQDSGATMIAATAVLRNHKTRIGKIGGNITLPRAVELQTIVAVGLGMLVGLILVAFVNPSFRTYMYAAVFGGAIGYFLVNYSPLQGESMLKWMGLALNAKRQQVKIDGQPVRLAIGVAYISEPARGKVRFVRGAVTVPPSQFDERGVQITAKNRNLPEQLNVSTKTSRKIGAADKASRIADGSVPLPSNEERSLETRAGKAAAAAAAGKVTGILGKLGKEKEAPQAKVGRLAAARAAQEQATVGNLGISDAPGWTGRIVRGAQEVQDPFSSPPQSLPGSEAPKSQRGANVPAQPGPRDLTEDPFAGKPKKLPR